jgi:hypothetical protein
MVINDAERMLRMNIFYTLLFIGAGLFAITGASLNAEWFMGDPKAQIFVRLLGRTGTRIMYIILGVFLVIFGFVGFFDFFGLFD